MYWLHKNFLCNSCFIFNKINKITSSDIKRKKLYCWTLYVSNSWKICLTNNNVFVFLTAVRRGRYTHQIKVKNIIEAKKHRAGISPYEVPVKSEATKQNKTTRSVTHIANGSPNRGSPASSEQLITPISVTEISSILQNNTSTTVPNNNSPMLNSVAYTTPQNNGYVPSNGIVQQNHNIGTVPARVSDRLTSTGTSSSSISTSSEENGILDTDFLNYSPDAFDGFEIEVSSCCKIRMCFWNHYKRYIETICLA